MTYTVILIPSAARTRVLVTADPDELLRAVTTAQRAGLVAAGGDPRVRGATSGAASPDEDRDPEGGVCREEHAGDGLEDRGGSGRGTCADDVADSVRRSKPGAAGPAGGPERCRGVAHAP